MAQHPQPSRDIGPRNLDFGLCSACGRRSYQTRKIARRAARTIYPGQHLCTYRCGDAWHIGHRRPRPEGDMNRTTQHEEN
ncbi:hypothetical protein [Streptomyces sp. NPDC091212]|uniref:hypothetical protein n=1 Tax=Streptomyces sp. NPDC091212 TaxID=3155191 RepID=UPI00344100F3